jgi:hypothetical protein
MVRAPRRFFDTVVWRQFSELHTDLWLSFEQTTKRLIREAIDAETVPRSCVSISIACSVPALTCLA